jgi:ribonuclease HI
MSQPNAFYAVAIGRATGVFRTWAECCAMVRGVPNARFKKFQTETEALAFVQTMGSPLMAQIGATVTVIPSASSVAASETQTQPPPLQQAFRPLKSPSERRVAQGGSAPAPAPPPASGGIFAAFGFASPSAQPAALSVAEKAPTELVCFTDGACSANGQAGARAAYAVVWPDAPAYDVAARLSGPVQTNNRAEYTAAIAALQSAERRDPTRRLPLTIYSDSKLLIDSVTRWMANWKRRGWRKSDGAEVANADLLQALDDAIARRSGGVKWVHVAAHTGRADYASRWNDAADRAAVTALVAGI